MRGHLVIGVIFSMIPNLSKSVTGSPPLFHTVLFKGNESIQRFFLVLFVPILRSAWMTVQDVVVCQPLHNQGIPMVLEQKISQRWF